VTRTIELREYEQRRVDLSDDEIDALIVAADDRLVVRRASGGRWTLTASQHVGVFVTPDVWVLVQPKVSLQNLFLLLGVAPPTFAGSPAGFDHEGGLLAVMAAVFARAADRSTARGILRGYRHTEERLVAPRGRIDVVAQLRRPGEVSPLACSFDEFTPDVFENRVLLAAIDRLRRVPAMPAPLRADLGRLLPRFDEVAVTTVDDEAIDSWAPNRLNAHYEPAIRLAAIILRNLTLANRVGATAGGSFSVDMNALFQRFVADRLRRALRRSLVVVEEPSVPLVRNRRLTMLPDLVLRRPTRGGLKSADVYVGDVKYKLTGGSARMPDYYQLLAYTTAMGMDEGVLIYAQDDDSPIAPTDAGPPIRTIEVRNTSILLHVYRLPLTGTNDQVEAGLRALADWMRTRVEQQLVSLVG
jgi:5-methylcytosine-specific restriction enzyme subunit McrC